MHSHPGGAAPNSLDSGGGPSGLVLTIPESSPPPPSPLSPSKADCDSPPPPNGLGPEGFVRVSPESPLSKPGGAPPNSREPGVGPDGRVRVRPESSPPPSDCTRTNPFPLGLNPGGKAWLAVTPESSPKEGRRSLEMGTNPDDN